MRCLTPRFQTIAEAVSKLRCRSVTLDGELVFGDDSGINFYRLRGARPADDVTYWVFDILKLNGAEPRSVGEAGGSLSRRDAVITCGNHVVEIVSLWALDLLELNAKEMRSHPLI